VALILAAFGVDVPMLSGGSPASWHGWVHGIAFLLIIATGVLTPLAMALAVRGDPGWRPIAVISVAASAFFVVFLLLPWGNATFLIAIMTLFAWICSGCRTPRHTPLVKDSELAVIGQAGRPPGYSTTCHDSLRSACPVWMPTIFS
jgi:hypothetical protein